MEMDRKLHRSALSRMHKATAFARLELHGHDSCLLVMAMLAWSGDRDIQRPASRTALISDPH